MRDIEKDESYFKERYNKDSDDLTEILNDFHNDIEIGEHPEEFNIKSYKYQIFINAFYKFYAGYSLGLDVNELIPEIKLILRNLLDTTNENDSNYEDMEYILHFIILFNQNEFLIEYKELLEKSEHRDFYLDSLMQYLDSSWEISTEKILWEKDMKPLCEVIQLSKADKDSAVQRQGQRRLHRKAAKRRKTAQWIAGQGERRGEGPDAGLAGRNLCKHWLHGGAESGVIGK